MSKRKGEPTTPVKALDREGVVETLLRIVEEVEKDPEMWKKEEEAQRKYGTLTAEDLAITFTI